LTMPRTEITGSVLRGVSIEAPRGEVTCVLGRNGVGKTVPTARDVGVGTGSEEDASNHLGVGD
jgi:ABC-type Mn2+/Zn2+ transport system ATPase subunit